MHFTNCKTRERDIVNKAQQEWLKFKKALEGKSRECTVRTTQEQCNISKMLRKE